eukprot:Opistho-1_new@29740
MAPQSCRFYEARFPEVDDVVMVNVRSIAEMGAYVKLLEYNNIDGMILLSELSRRRIRSINKLIRVGRDECVVVLRVDKEKGYIDLSKRRVSTEEVRKADEKFNKAKAVNSILRHVADTLKIDLEELYTKTAWPLDRKYGGPGSSYEAFKEAVKDPEGVFGGLELDEKTREVLISNIRRRLTPQPTKIRAGACVCARVRAWCPLWLCNFCAVLCIPCPLFTCAQHADIEVSCYGYEGIDAIKESLRAGLACSKEDMAIKINLISPPLYVMTTTSLDKEKGVEAIGEAIAAIQGKIKDLGGQCIVKVMPRAVSETDEKELKNMLEELERKQEERPGDEDTSEEEEGAEGDE